MTEAISTFQFRRYRDEVASRALQKDCTEDAKFEEKEPPENHDETAKRSPSTVMDDDSNADGDGTVIENISNEIVVVDLNGNVSTEKKTMDSKDDSIRAENTDDNQMKQKKHICVVPEGTTLLLRNLQDCHLTIHLPLPAIHFVGIKNTDITYFNKSKDGCGKANDQKSNKVERHTAMTPTNETEKFANAYTAIHMTDCKGKSSLQLEASVQQLRIHRSIGLRVEMIMVTKVHPTIPISTNAITLCDWKPGTIILEASKLIVFCVPPLTNVNPSNQSLRERELTESTKRYWDQIIVKDFQWLRKGIASPNFQIVVLEVSDEYRNNTYSTEDSNKTLESSRNILTHQTAETEQVECEDDTDSDDEL